jgi:hypothetical protein
MGETEDAQSLLEGLLVRHARPPLVLLARVMHAPPAGSWARVLRRPASIGEVVRAVEALLPLPAGARRPVD